MNDARQLPAEHQKIEVSLNYLGPIRDYAGKSRETLHVQRGCTVFDLLRDWHARYHVPDPIREGIIILINGSSANSLPQKCDTPLAAGDEIFFLSPLSGG